MVDRCPEWLAHEIPRAEVGGAGTYGAQFIGDTMSIQVSTQAPKLNAPPPGLTMPAHNDSSFPLDASLLSGIEGGLGGQFYGDGLQYDVTVLSPPLPGPLSASDQVDHGPHHLVDHLPAMVPGRCSQRLGGGPDADSDVSWVHLEGYLYMLFRTSDGYRLYGSISCAGTRRARRAPPRMGSRCSTARTGARGRWTLRARAAVVDKLRRTTHHPSGPSRPPTTER